MVKNYGENLSHIIVFSHHHHGWLEMIQWIKFEIICTFKFSDFFSGEKIEFPMSDGVSMAAFLSAVLYPINFCRKTKRQRSEQKFFVLMNDVIDGRLTWTTIKCAENCVTRRRHGTRRFGRRQTTSCRLRWSLKIWFLLVPVCFVYNGKVFLRI